MKSDLLYKVVFSQQNSLESIAMLNTLHGPDTAKLWEWMWMSLNTLFLLCQWNIQHLNVMLSTVRTLPTELNMHCKCSLASSSNRAPTVSSEGKKVPCLRVRNFHQLYFLLIFHFSFYLPFK